MFIKEFQSLVVLGVKYWGRTKNILPEGPRLIATTISFLPLGIQSEFFLPDSFISLFYFIPTHSSTAIAVTLDI